jgi:peroxiredoxin Q/BCP
MRAWVARLENRWLTSLGRSRFGRWVLRTAFGRFIARYFWVIVLYRIVKWPTIALIIFICAELGVKDNKFLSWFSPSTKSSAAVPAEGEAQVDQQSSHVSVGDSAPDFSLPLYEAGKEVRDFKLSELRGQTVVLYWYPMDDTPGCTAQACGLRDGYKEIRELGAQIIGVSGDDAQSHAAFAAKYELPFPLLVDEGGKIRALYGNPDGSEALVSRITFIIDGEGIVRHIVGGPGVMVDDHLAASFEWVKKLASEKAAQSPES